jgi:DNA-binding transcriptional LysR family regulator
MSAAEWLTKRPLLRLYDERGQGLNAQIDRFLHDNGLFISSTQLTDDIQTIVAMVIAGIGVAILPTSVTHIAPPELVIIPLTGESISWKVGIAWDASKEDVIRDNFIASIRKGISVDGGNYSHYLDYWRSCCMSGPPKLRRHAPGA